MFALGYALNLDEIPWQNQGAPEAAATGARSDGGDEDAKRGVCTGGAASRVHRRCRITRLMRHRLQFHRPGALPLYPCESAYAPAR